MFAVDANYQLPYKYDTTEITNSSWVNPESYYIYADQFKREKVEIGKGLEKIFEIRSYYNDINFISEFFTDEFCKEHQYYTFE